MIEKIIHEIIKELGPTGLLVVGLYYLLYRPLNEITKCVCEIQQELKILVAVSKVVIRNGNGKAKRTTIQLDSER